jgi:hypothetical protein
MSEQSTEIGQLAAALAVAQGKITGALKDSANPFFKSKYADLASVWDACRGPLSENGIAVVQTTDVDDQGIVIVTTLAHKSGEWMRGKMRLIPKDSSPQGFGSAITYGRRYGLAAIVGVAQVDDDANAASGRAGVTTVDPRGDMKGKADTKVVEDYARRFKEAMEADKEEAEIASDVYHIHTEVSANHELYIDIATALGSKYANALKKYVDIHKKAKKAA